MSGPKSADFTVVTNGEVRRRAREAARQAAEEVARRARAVAAEADIEVPEVDLDTASQAELEAWAADVADRCQAAEAARAAWRTTEALNRMLAALDAPPSRLPQRGTSASRPATPASPAPGSDAPDRRGRTAERVRQVVAGLDGTATEAETREVSRLAAAILAATTDPGASLLLDELRLRVHGIRQSAALRRQSRADARALLATLHGLDGAEVDGVRERLAAAEAGEAELPASLRAEVVQVAERARRAADRQYTANVLASALTELGYDVEEGFATLAGGPGGAQAAKWAAHAVRVQFTGGDGIALRVVREETGDQSDDQLREDREIEHEFCRDFARLSQRLEQDHVQLRITSQVMPGEQPVEAVDRLRVRRSRSAPAARGAAHELGP